MTDSQVDSPQAAESWDNYWQGIAEAGAHSVGGARHPAIKAFWQEVFFEAAQDYTNPAILDIASGSGPLLDLALLAFGVEGADITSIDISGAAIESIRQRYPSVHGLVADASSIPLEADKFDLVTSQFGVEYAGQEAIPEAVRLNARGGRLALMMHKKGSRIHNECEETLDAIERTQRSGFIPLATQMLRAGFAAVGGADREPYDTAGMKFAPAVAALEAVMKQYGKNVAGDTVLSLYSGVADIHENIQHYDPDEVLSWLERMDGELETFKGRMTSMLETATDYETFDRICVNLQELGYSTEQAGPLMVPGEDLPLAWIVVANKEAA